MRTGSETDTCPIKVSEYVLGCAGMTKRQAQPSSTGTESTDASPFPWSERSQQREQTRECSVPAPRDPGSQLPCVFMGANVFSFSLAPAWAGISISWHRVSLHMLAPQKGSHSNRYHHAMPQKTSQLEALGDWIRPERADTDMDTVSSVAQWCLSLRPMDWSTPGFPVLHQLLELAQTHVHRVSDAIQPSHPLSSPSPPTFNLSQHQDIFQWVSSLNQVAKVLEFQLQHQSFQWIFRTGKKF